MPASRILVPIDGSECSIHALEYAARRQQAAADTDVVVINVQSPIRPSRVLTRALIAEHHERNAAEALQPARAAIKRLGMRATCHTVTGDPAASIVAFAQKKRCDEIVMGNNGRGAVAGMVMGSVARKVVLLAKTPVVLVK